MEIIETIAWVALGFVPTILSLEFISKYRSRLGSTHDVDRFVRVKTEVRA